MSQGTGRELSFAALVAALDAVSGMAFVIRSAPIEVIFANASARAEYDANLDLTLTRLDSAIRDGSRDGTFVARLGEGGEDHALVVLRPAAPDWERSLSQ